jgi:branched-chain amino acid transport system substrate-binding protein
LKRAGGASDKQALLDAIGATNLETIAGKVDFTNPVVPHVTKTPLVGGQWVASEQWDVEFKIVTNEQLPGIPIDGPLEPIAY